MLEKADIAISIFIQLGAGNHHGVMRAVVVQIKENS
jgi:hypothetical protein